MNETMKMHKILFFSKMYEWMTATLFLNDNA